MIPLIVEEFFELLPKHPRQGRYPDSANAVCHCPKALPQRVVFRHNYLLRQDDSPNGSERTYVETRAADAGYLRSLIMYRSVVP